MVTVKMELELGIIQIKLHTQANGAAAINMDKELRLGQTDTYTKELFKIVNGMDKGL